MDRRSSPKVGSKAAKVGSTAPKVGSTGKGKKASKAKRKRSKVKGGTIPGAAIKRVAKKSGAIRVGGDLIEAGNKVLSHFVDTIITDAVLYADHARRKTVMDGDITLSLKRHNIDIPVFMDQDRLTIPKATFQRLVRRAANNDSLHFQSTALILLQCAAEKYCSAYLLVR
jgi:histone H4